MFIAEIWPKHYAFETKKLIFKTISAL